MMTCRELTELLLEFVAEQLPPERHTHVEQHLKGCQDCTAYVGSYRILINLGRRLRDDPLPPRLEQQLEAILRDNGNDPLS